MNNLGTGTWLRLGYRPVAFAIDPKDGALTHLWCGAVGRDLLLVWEAGDDETGWGGVARVKLDPVAPRFEAGKVIFPVLGRFDAIAVDAETGRELEPPDQH